ncbi:hypothetical protein BDZ89DRAFT_1147947 [Hymenopellis radicata]|nr:hypothetical protein BDZ89DRAFT_1147947 [Hymenopellis radicata]
MSESLYEYFSQYRRDHFSRPEASLPPEHSEHQPDDTVYKPHLPYIQSASYLLCQGSSYSPFQPGLFAGQPQGYTNDNGLQYITTFPAMVPRESLYAADAPPDAHQGAHQDVPYTARRPDLYSQSGGLPQVYHKERQSQPSNPCYHAPSPNLVGPPSASSLDFAPSITVASTPGPASLHSMYQPIADPANHYQLSYDGVTSNSLEKAYSSEKKSRLMACFFCHDPSSTPSIVRSTRVAFVAWTIGIGENAEAASFFGAGRVGRINAVLRATKAGLVDGRRLQIDSLRTLCAFIGSVSQTTLEASSLANAKAELDDDGTVLELSMD